MNYLRDKRYAFHDRERSSWKKPLSLAIAILILYLWGSALFTDALSFVTYPFVRLTGRVRSGFFESLQTQKRLIEENRRLKESNARLREADRRALELEKDNLRLRGLREGGVVAENRVFADIIAKPNQVPYDELLINLGSLAAPWLKTGQLVFADSHVVLGQIDQVSPRFSRVKLYSTSGVNLPVSVGTIESPAIAEGRGSGNFSLSLPRGADIREGDPVKTSIIGSYILGYVGTIEKNPNNPFQKILFRCPYNLFELGQVELIHD